MSGLKLKITTKYSKIDQKEEEKKTDDKILPKKIQKKTYLLCTTYLNSSILNRLLMQVGHLLICIINVITFVRFLTSKM